MKTEHNRIGIISVVVAVIGIGIWMWATKDSPQSYSQVTHQPTRSSTIEVLKVRAGEWTSVSTDETQERFDLDPTDRGIDWFIVVNKDFNHPIPISGKGPKKSLGNGISSIDISLPAGSIGSTEFILKRFPK